MTGKALISSLVPVRSQKDGCQQFLAPEISYNANLYAIPGGHETMFTTVFNKFAQSFGCT